MCACIQGCGLSKSSPLELVHSITSFGEGRIEKAVQDIVFPLGPRQIRFLPIFQRDKFTVLLEAIA